MAVIRVDGLWWISWPFHTQELQLQKWTGLVGRICFVNDWSSFGIDEFINVIAPRCLRCICLCCPFPQDWHQLLLLLIFHSALWLECLYLTESILLLPLIHHCSCGFLRISICTHFDWIGMVNTAGTGCDRSACSVSFWFLTATVELFRGHKL